MVWIDSLTSTKCCQWWSVRDHKKSPGGNTSCSWTPPPPSDYYWLITFIRRHLSCGITNLQDPPKFNCYQGESVCVILLIMNLGCPSAAPVIWAHLNTGQCRTSHCVTRKTERQVNQDPPLITLHSIQFCMIFALKVHHIVLGKYIWIWRERLILPKQVQ